MKYLYVAATPDIEAPTDREALLAVKHRVAAALDAPIREMPLPAIDFAWDAARRQYGSIPVLEMLTRSVPPDALRLLAVTARDLFIPVLTFVYGHAQLNGPAAVISLARLKQEFYGLAPNREIFLERAAKEALHEAGHTFGLVHCQDKTCVMALSTNIRQIDSKRSAFCAACGARLRRRSGSTVT